MATVRPSVEIVEQSRSGLSPAAPSSSSVARLDYPSPSAPARVRPVQKNGGSFSDVQIGRCAPRAGAGDHHRGARPRRAARPPTRQRTEVGIAETDEELFVAPASGDPSVRDWWVVDPRPSGRRPQRGPVADDIEGILELVAAGLGVNIAAASAEA
jgi:hypothetical protein